jgi:hypothetical protein
MLGTKNKPLDKLDALIFIDTNIFLDFYRIRGDGVGLGLLEKIGDHHDRIITDSQIEMEKKNRQQIILDSLKAVKDTRLERSYSTSISRRRTAS